MYSIDPVFTKHITKQEYFKLYPSGSSPGKFYGTAKLHKIGKNGNINDLPLRPLVSNIGTATYHLAKHLSKVLSPLRNSEYTIKNTKDFLVQLKKRKNTQGSPNGFIRR